MDRPDVPADILDRSRTHRQVVGMVVEDTEDWDEIAELLPESHCLLAPRKLVPLAGRPGPAAGEPG
jgi:hypothetical protein